ncbi:BON domain-containing protein [Cupriavidus basilensis]|uniref:BON domain-containing protein n=1 Tax=Cupriavidus basilensis TaxID=68895 RepID=UPI0004482007|nr:BON domain-containing protein [Cupriavidus basilensis]MDF3884311.1 BON domain-containing protein [Cupriavidus basilensis]
MKTDLQIKLDVSDELAWDPAVDAATVGVEVNHGVVTLSGHLRTYVEKLAAERAAERVAGVKAVVVELDVRVPGAHDDEAIAEAARAALQWHAGLPASGIKVRVEKGWVSLAGEVEWAYQRELAERSVEHLRGLAGVINQISIKPRIAPPDVAKRIDAALRRHAEREAAHIRVEVLGSVVTLEGKVDSPQEREAALGAAWSAPGVTKVVDHLALS